MLAFEPANGFKSSRPTRSRCNPDIVVVIEHRRICGDGFLQAVDSHLVVKVGDFAGTVRVMVCTTSGRPCISSASVSRSLRQAYDAVDNIMDPTMPKTSVT